MVYMMAVSGRLWECSATLKIFRPHLVMSSRSYQRADCEHLSRSHDTQVIIGHNLSIAGLPSTAAPPGLSWPRNDCWSSQRCWACGWPSSPRWSESSSQPAAAAAAAAAGPASFSFPLTWEPDTEAPTHSAYLDKKKKTQKQRGDG